MPRFVIILYCLLMTDSALAAASLKQLQQQITQKQFAAAADSGEALLRQNANHLQVRFLTAYAFQMSSKTDAAIALYQALIQDHPDLPEPRNNLAMIYLKNGDHDRAINLLLEALNTHPSYATAYGNLRQVYQGLASESYRNAVAQSNNPKKIKHKFALTAIAKLDADSRRLIEADPANPPTAINFANQETLLIERVKLWAQAWSSKDIAGYINFYAPQHRAKFGSHAQWVKHRRQRIARPGEISIDVSNIQIKWRSETRAIIDFRQAYDSSRYSDRVIKRLGFNRIGSQWKITEERVLSVL